jgi:Tfp pilus assembly protein PilN
MKILINLLPEEKKKKLRTNEISVWLLRVGFLVVLAIIVFASFLASFLFVIDIQKKVYEEEIEKIRSSENNILIQEAKKKIRNYNQKAGLIEENLSSDGYYWKIIQKLNETLPGGVYYSQVELSQEKILMKGFAEKREDLINFEKRIRESEHFQNVEFPISSFTSKENINFEIVFKHID